MKIDKLISFSFNYQIIKDRQFKTPYTFNNNISTMYPIKIKAHERNINIVRFNYDGDLFFSGEADRLINVFEAYTG